jgi:hypothetical protein
MRTNEILDEIRRVREEDARECNYDVGVLFDKLRAEEEKWRALGWTVVAPDSRALSLHDDAPNPKTSLG